ncbi:MAG: CBS domain-containing protein [Candidatus Doudnabacteria bacterium]|nr:CBS domain-containing protein [Candidatus Doudnabacteria bacterium]
MPYISELLNNKIYDSSDEIVGKLQDILISPKEANFAPLEFLVIKTRDRQTKFVPYEYVANFDGSQITLKNLFNKAFLSQLPSGHQYVYLKKDILDRQIVDVVGTRVVRVNDLRISVFENKMCVVGIDASFRGLLRRLGWSGSTVPVPFKVNLIDFREAKLLDNRGPLQLSTVAEQLAHLHPADLANIVEDLDIKYGSSLLASLDSAEAAKVLEEVDPTLQTLLVKYLGPEQAGKILSKMSSDELVDLVKTLSSQEASELLGDINVGHATNLQKLISYPDNTAGGLMTVDFVSARPDWTVAQTIDEIRKQSEKMRSIVHVYITDESGGFKGIVSVRRLLLAKPGALMTDLAKQFPRHSSLKPGDSTEKIIKLMTKYNLYTAAVLDKDKKLAGVVTIDDIMRQLFPSA